jgi:hypothetical protein
MLKYYGALSPKVSVNITEYGAIGQYISGTFSGNLRTQATPTPTVPVSGSFRIKRTQ